MIYGSDPLWTLLAYGIVGGTVGALVALGFGEVAKSIYRRLAHRPVRGGWR